MFHRLIRFRKTVGIQNACSLLRMDKYSFCIVATRISYHWKRWQVQITMIQWIATTHFPVQSRPQMFNDIVVWLLWWPREMGRSLPRTQNPVLDNLRCVSLYQWDGLDHPKYSQNSWQKCVLEELSSTHRKPWYRWPNHHKRQAILRNKQSVL